jgi:hypothetical protein
MKKLVRPTVALLALTLLASAGVAVAGPKGQERREEKREERKEKREERREERQERREERKEERQERREEAKEQRKAQRKAWQEARRERRKQRLETWGRSLGVLAGRPLVRAEVKLHVRRIARLERMRYVAETEDKPALLARIDALLVKERTRHDRRIEALKANGGAQ